MYADEVTTLTVYDSSKAILDELYADRDAMHSASPSRGSRAGKAVASKESGAAASRWLSLNSMMMVL